MGVPALDILGWVEPPNYNISNHRLVWSIKKPLIAARLQIFPH